MPKNLSAARRGGVGCWEGRLLSPASQPLTTTLDTAQLQIRLKPDNGINVRLVDVVSGDCTCRLQRPGRASYRTFGGGESPRAERVPDFLYRDVFGSSTLKSPGGIPPPPPPGWSLSALITALEGSLADPRELPEKGAEEVSKGDVPLAEERRSWWRGMFT